MTDCKICQRRDFQLVYKGPIRIGKFGEFSSQAHCVLSCTGCGVRFLEGGEALDYSSSDYRNQVNGDNSPQTYYRLHDGEQAERLNIIGTSELRAKNVADVGCGAGSFLNLVSGLAQNTIGIELNPWYLSELESKGHLAFASTAQAVDHIGHEIDLAVSFAVIEHVSDPVKFLSEIRQLLKAEGKLLISTPNANDWLLETLPQEYSRFFYRQAHLWYFNARSIEFVAKQAGFSKAQVKFHNQYDFSNALMWLKEKKPTGNKAVGGWQDFDGHWKAFLEQTGRANYLYAWLYP